MLALSSIAQSAVAMSSPKFRGLVWRKCLPQKQFRVF